MSQDRNHEGSREGGGDSHEEPTIAAGEAVTQRWGAGADTENVTAVLPGGATPISQIGIFPRIEGYRILREIASGGMGTVYQAEQLSRVRKVALKVVKAGMAAPEVLRRFGYEAQVLALLQHEGIARIYEAGTFDAGAGPQPFFAMEFVEGETLTRYARKERLDVRQEIELMIRVCDAVQHAHQRAFIHRDLKPANILVDARGQPKILDFGLARATDPDVLVTSMRTEVGQVVGTAVYMSPEQTEGRHDELDTRSDVYTLGVILFELLTGELPYDIKGRMIHEVLSTIRNSEPILLRSHDRALAGDLETIIRKTLEKDPERRYESAAALAADLGRYLRDEPIAARAPSVWYQLSKFARRNKTLVSAAALVLAALVAGIIGTTWQAARARQSERRALEMAALADENARKARAALAESRHEQFVSAIQYAQTAIREGRFSTADKLLHDIPEDLRRWEWGRLMFEIHSELIEFRGHGGRVLHARFSPDGGQVSTASEDNTARIWDTETGLVAVTLTGHADAVTMTAWSPDGSRMVTSSRDGTVRVWDAASGREVLALAGHEGIVAGVAFSPDGSRIASAGADRTLRLWDSAEGTPLRTLTGHSDIVWRVEFSPDGKRLITASFDRSARIWDAETGEARVILSGHSNVVTGAAFSPDGLYAVTGSRDRTVRIWNAADGTEIRAMTEHTENVTDSAFSPDGKFVVSASGDRTACVWETATGSPVTRFSGHLVAIESAAFSPDGRRVLTASGDRTARLWRAGSDPDVIALAPPERSIRCAAFSPVSGYLAWAMDDNTIRVRRVFGEGPGPPGEITLSGHEALVVELAFSPDGTRLLSGAEDATARIWDCAAGHELALLRGHTKTVQSLAFSPDAARVATGSDDTTARVWDAVTGAEVSAATGHQGSIRCVVFSADGRRILTGSEDGTARIWDAASGAAVAALEGHTDRVERARRAPGGGWFVTASADSTARVWDDRTGRPLSVLEGHAGRIPDLAITADSLRIATASQDRTARVWDARTGRELAVMRGHGETLRRVTFSPDEQRIATASVGTAAVWEAASGRELVSLPGHTGIVDMIEFSPDGKSLLTANRFDRTARIWRSVPWLANDLPGDASMNWHERFRLWQTARLQGLLPFRAEISHEENPKPDSPESRE